MSAATHCCAHCGDDIEDGEIDEHLADECDNVVFVDGAPVRKDAVTPPSERQTNLEGFATDGGESPSRQTTETDRDGGSE